MAGCPAVRRDRELLEPPAPPLSQRPLPFLWQGYELHWVALAAFALTIHLALKRVHYHLDMLIGYLNIWNAGIVRRRERLPGFGRQDVGQVLEHRDEPGGT